MKHFVMTGSDRPDGDSELTLASVHLHYMTAKKEVAQGSAALARFRDDLARILVTWRVRVLAGDFNMALWQVVPELRARGLCANMAAWRPWEFQGQAAPRIDSCGMSLLGPDGGPRCLFGPTALRGGGDQRGCAEMFDLVEESAVADGGSSCEVLAWLRVPAVELSTSRACTDREACEVVTDANQVP